MYAIIEASGLQFRVAEGDVIRVPMLIAEPGSSHQIDKVYLVGGEKTQVGKPIVEGAKVETVVVAHGKGEKAIIYKKKKRTKYRRTRGHRQDYTDLKIERISVG